MNFIPLCLPKRYVFAIVGFLVILVGHMMRISLDVTISSMINQTTVVITPQKYDPDSCPDLTTAVSNRSLVIFDYKKQVVFDWDESTRKSVLSVFRTAYIMTQFLGGMVADGKGGRKIMIIALAMFSVSTFVIPVASKLLGSTALYVLRFISGMASGTLIPILFSMMSKWVPKEEQAFIGSIIFPGSLIGYVTGSWLGNKMLTTLGWEAVFYVFGILGTICTILWVKLIHSTPNDHPTVIDIEKIYLNSSLPALERTTKNDLDPLPFKAFLRSGAVWGTVIGYIGRQWAFSTFSKQLPQFMKDVMHLDVAFSPYFIYMPYIVMWLTALLFGFTCDIMIKKEFCSVKNARKIFNGIGTIGAVVCIMIVMYSGCNPILALFSMFSGMAALGAFYSGCMIGALDIAPNYAGTTIGIVDNIAINSELLLPRINAMIVTDALLQQWRLSLWIVNAILLICIIIYVYYVQAEQMWWDDVRKNGYPENWKHGLLSCEGLIDENGKSIYKENDKEGTSVNQL